jgi:hypothetical protein
VAHADRGSPNPLREPLHTHPSHPNPVFSLSPSLSLSLDHDPLHPPFTNPYSPSPSNNPQSPPELVDLRKRFEDDRRRIAELRAARNFKPY